MNRWAGVPSLGSNRGRRASGGRENMKPRTLGLMLIGIALIAGVITQMRAETTKGTSSPFSEQRKT